MPSLETRKMRQRCSSLSRVSPNLSPLYPQTSSSTAEPRLSKTMSHAFPKSQHLKKKGEEEKEADECGVRFIFLLIFFNLGASQFHTLLCKPKCNGILLFCLQENLHFH